METQNTENTQTAAPVTGPAGTAADPIPLKKMTQKALGIEPKNVRTMPIIEGQEPPMIRLGTFFGLVQGIKYKDSDFSDEPNALFIGEFRAIHPTTGKIYTSEKSYWFKGMADKLEATFKTGEGKPVEFAYEVFSKSVPDSQLGYEYTAVSLIQTAASNRMDAIAEAVQNRLQSRAALNAPADPNPAQVEAEKSVQTEAAAPAAGGNNKKKGK